MIRLLALGAVVLAGCQCRSPTVPTSTTDPRWLEGSLPPESGAPRRGGTLTVRVPLEPAGLTRLHDRFAEGTMTRLTVGPVYETLARSEDGALQPLLAERWVESADHLRLEITLRAGVRFHDGAALTSADVKRTLEVVMNPENATAAFRASIEPLASVDAPDPRTLVIRWARPLFLATHTVLTALPILPAHRLEGAFDTLPLHRAPVGTGPFKFESWEPGVQLTLVRADDRAHLDRVRLRFVKDDTAAMQALERGEFDLFLRLTPSAWRSLESQPWAQRGYHRVRFQENAYAWIGFNQRRAPFADVAVRRALARAYPAALIARTVDLDLEPRTHCPWQQGSPSCDPSVTSPGFDLDAARLELQQAGWGDADHDGVLEKDGHPLRFAFLIAAQSVKMNKLVPLYLDTLHQLGVDARLETVDVSAYMTRVRAHDFDAIALSWASADTEQDNYGTFHSSQADGGNNFVGYANPRVDTLLEAIRAEFNPAARHALEQQAHRLLLEDQVYLFLGTRPSLDLVSKRVHGLRPALSGYDLAKVWVDP